MALSMYRDSPEFGHVNVHGQGHIRPCPCSTSSNRIIRSTTSNKGPVPYEIHTTAKQIDRVAENRQRPEETVNFRAGHRLAILTINSETKG
jgi:hypothetical protein